MKTPKYISILSDYGFKVTFGDENNTLFLRKSLQALIGSKIPIKEVKFIQNEFYGLTINSRAGLYDLHCIDEHGNSFIVEMQRAHFKNFIQRSKFYAFQRFNTLINKGNFNYENLPKIYCISFLSHAIYKKSKLYYHKCTLQNQNGEKIDDQITHIIVEISKFDKKESEIESDLDKLIFLMTDLERILQTIDLPPFMAEDWIEQAVKKLAHVNMTPDQKMFFEITKAKQGFLREVNRLEKEEAIKKAVEEKEINLKKKMAKALKKEGMTATKISEIIGLPIEAIEKL